MQDKFRYLVNYIFSFLWPPYTLTGHILLTSGSVQNFHLVFQYLNFLILQIHVKQETGLKSCVCLNYSWLIIQEMKSGLRISLLPCCHFYWLYCIGAILRILLRPAYWWEDTKQRNLHLPWRAHKEDNMSRTLATHHHIVEIILGDYLALACLPTELHYIIIHVHRAHL